MKHILIYGTGIAGQDILKEVRQNKELNFIVVGFLDDDEGLMGQQVLGLPVLGSGNQISRLAKDKKVDQIIIAIPSAEGKRISEIVKICSQSKVGFRIVPRVKEIIEGKAHVSKLREVEVGDLLGRPVIKSDVKELADFFSGKKVLITGAAGSIGSELSRQIAAYGPHKIVFFDWWENGLFELQMELAKDSPKLSAEYIIANMQDEQKVKNVFSHANPDYVFHAAAYKHVPLMEINPDEAVKNNVFGTLNIAQEAVKNAVQKFVLV